MSEPYQIPPHPENSKDTWLLLGGFVGTVLAILGGCVALGWLWHWLLES